MNPWGISEAAAVLYRDALVWNDHSGFEPLPSADLGQLQRWRAAGVDYLSINVGYDVVGWQETFRALAAYRRWVAQTPSPTRLREPSPTSMPPRPRVGSPSVSTSKA